MAKNERKKNKDVTDEIENSESLSCEENLNDGQIDVSDVTLSEQDSKNKNNVNDSSTVNSADKIENSVEAEPQETKVAAKKNSKARTLTKRIAFSAVFMALIIVFTSFVKVPIGIGGYVHLGDLMIYLCASVLPLPFAIIVAGLGGALSDVIAGYAIWAPFTLVIKMLLVVCFTPKKGTVLCLRNYIAAAICLVITMVGYFFSEVIIYGDWGAYVNMPWNLIQALISGVVYIIIGIALDKLKVKERILQL